MHPSLFISVGERQLGHVSPIALICSMLGVYVSLLLTSSIVGAVPMCASRICPMYAGNEPTYRCLIKAPLWMLWICCSSFGTNVISPPLRKIAVIIRDKAVVHS